MFEGRPSRHRIPDARVGDAVRVVESKRQADEQWLLDARYDEGIAVPSQEIRISKADRSVMKG